MDARAAHRPRLLVVEHEPAAGVGRFGPEFDAAGADTRTLRPYAGDAVPDRLPDDVDGLLVLGGAAAAWEDDACPWLPATRSLLRNAVESEVPTLGVCLGAQLLALATGGVVEPAGHGPEIGVGSVRLRPDADDDPLLRDLGPSRPAAQWHSDVVLELPPGAAWLADGDVYPHQAFRLGQAAWGVQFHPEVTADDFAAWAGVEPDAGREHGIDVTAAVAAVRDRDRELDDAWRPLPQRFAALLDARVGLEART